MTVFFTIIFQSASSPNSDHRQKGVTLSSCPWCNTAINQARLTDGLVFCSPALLTDLIESLGLMLPRTLCLFKRFFFFKFVLCFVYFLFQFLWSFFGLLVHNNLWNEPYTINSTDIKISACEISTKLLQWCFWNSRWNFIFMIIPNTYKVVKL